MTQGATPASQPTAIIVDDEAAVLSHLQQMLADCWPELRVIDTAQNGREALAKIGEQVPDIVFLDIKMPGMTGLDVARKLSKQVHMVFVTAFDEYAVDAFEQAATDYLLKPVAQTRLTETVNRLKNKLEQNLSAEPARFSALLEKLGQSAPATQEWLQWLRVGHGDEVELIATNDVVYLLSLIHI